MVTQDNTHRLLIISLGQCVTSLETKHKRADQSRFLIINEKGCFLAISVQYLNILHLHEIPTPARDAALCIVHRTGSDTGQHKHTEVVWQGICAGAGVHLRWIQVEKTDGRGGHFARWSVHFNYLLNYLLWLLEFVIIIFALIPCL